MLALVICGGPAGAAGGGAGERASEHEPPPAGPPRLVVQVGHAGPVLSVAFSPDGRTIVTGSHDFTARLWDVGTGAEMRVLAGAGNKVTSVAFSRDGRRVITGSWDKTARLWDAHGGTELRSFRHSGRVTSVALSPDGRWALTGCDDAARLWDAETGQELRAFTGQEKGVASVAFSPDGRRVLTGGNDGTARMWDAATGKELRSFAGHEACISTVAFSPDGGRLLAVESLHNDLDGTTISGVATLWDIVTGKELRSFSDSSRKITGAAFSPDGRRVVTGSESSYAKLWDARTGKQILSFENNHGRVNSVTFSPDGRRVLAGLGAHAAVLWDAQTGKELRSFSGHSTEAHGAVFSPDGRRLLVGGDGDQIADLWNLETGEMTATLRDERGHTRRYDAFLARDGRRVITYDLYDFGRLATIWDVDTGKAVHYLPVLPADAGPRLHIAAGGRRAVTSASGLVMLWDLDSGALLRSFQVPSNFFRPVFSPDERRIVTSTSQDFRFWDLDTGRELPALRYTPAPETINASTIAFSPDGRRVLLGHCTWPKDATSWPTSWSASLRAADSGKELVRFADASACEEAAAFSPDGRWVATAGISATAGIGPTAKLWDAETGREIRSFAGHVGRILSVTFSPDGRRLLTTSTDHSSKVWDPMTGACLATLVSFTDRTWAVVDPSGRFDASNHGDVDGLHWVVGETPIALSQLRRYYEPGLLAKVMGLDKEPLRPVEGFAAPRLFPLVAVSPPAPGSNRLRIRLRNQGGGIGKVQVLVNGKEIAGDARGAKVDPAAREAALEVSLSGPAINPGQENRVEVIASDAQGFLSSRGAEVLWRAPGAKEVEPPEVFAIVSGASHYASPSMNLSFAGKDAADMATAIQVSAGRLFGAEKVHLTLLTDYPSAVGAQPPSRDNLRQAFEAARKARHDDLLIVYLAGHGATSPDGEYWYLTREARSTDLSDPQARAVSGVSSAELTDWIKAVPVTKQVMILDTCAAGAAAARLTEARALPSDQLRAIARLKDRTGLYVLMGSAADAVSYEASRFGQGLLTYALLQGIKGAALREDQYVDVATLFEHATDEVPRLARSIGGIQRPTVSAPRGASFDIGRLTVEDKPLIPVSTARPMILRATFQSAEPPFADELDLSRLVNAGLREAADPATRGGRIGFVDGDDLPGALRLTGRYRKVGGAVQLDSYLLDGSTVRGHFELAGSAAEPDALARAVVERAEQAILGVQVRRE